MKGADTPFPPWIEREGSSDDSPLIWYKLYLWRSCHCRYVEYGHFSFPFSYADRPTRLPSLFSGLSRTLSDKKVTATPVSTYSHRGPDLHSTYPLFLTSGRRALLGFPTVFGLSFYPTVPGSSTLSLFLLSLSFHVTGVVFIVSTYTGYSRSLLGVFTGTLVKRDPEFGSLSTKICTFLSLGSSIM